MSEENYTKNFVKRFLAVIKEVVQGKSTGYDCDYISWGACHQWMGSNVPDYEMEYVENNGSYIFKAGNGGLVKTRVKADCRWFSAVLSITGSGGTKGLPFDKIESHDVQNCLQRCLAKNISLHGYGLKLWFSKDEYYEAYKQLKNES